MRPILLRHPPAVVAEAVLRLERRPLVRFYAGWSARWLVLGHALVPGLAAAALRLVANHVERAGHRRAASTSGAVLRPMASYAVSGGWRRRRLGWWLLMGGAPVRAAAVVAIGRRTGRDAECS